MARQRQPKLRRRGSTESSSSESSFPEAEIYDEEESMMQHHNDSQSSLGVSLKDMEIDADQFEEQCRISPISRLPAEILMHIFSKIPSNADLRNCMLVCKSWARNSVDLLWHRPATHRWESLSIIIQTASKQDGYFAYHDLIKRLNLAQLSSVVNDGTIQPLAGCKRIERLTLTNCSKLTDQSVAALIEGNKNLLAVDITGLYDVTDVTMQAIAGACYKLQGLNISKCPKITDESLIEVAKNCRRVKRLKFNECSQLTDVSIKSFADYCPDLLEIDLYNCEELTDVSVTALISRCRQLREFKIARCSKITDEAFLRLPNDIMFESLRILDLTDCNELQDAGLQKIVNAAPRLRNLVLAKCRKITDRGLMAITRLGKNLHFIHLGHCNQITDYGVSNLVRLCNRIRYIDLACCVELTDESVKLLATLQKLKRIGLVKCSLITDASIKALAMAQPHHCNHVPSSRQNSLERLHLSYCANLTIQSIRYLLINCPRLTHLSLTGVHDFLQEDLLAFCREAPPEFNEHQRDVFCVFSGPGVAQLRKHLSQNYNPDGSPVSEHHQDYAQPSAPGFDANGHPMNVNSGLLDMATRQQDLSLDGAPLRIPYAGGTFPPPPPPPPHSGPPGYARYNMHNQESYNSNNLHPNRSTVTPVPLLPPPPPQRIPSIMPPYSHLNHPLPGQYMSTLTSDDVATSSRLPANVRLDAEMMTVLGMTYNASADPASPTRTSQPPAVEGELNSDTGPADGHATSGQNGGGRVRSFSAS